MNELKEFFENIEHKITMATTVAECEGYQAQMEKLCKSFHEMRRIKILMDTDAYGAWDMDMEHCEGRADDLAKLAEDQAADIKDEGADEEYEYDRRAYAAEARADFRADR